MNKVFWFLLVFVSTIIILISCVSYRERPEKLYKEVVSSHQVFDVGIVPGVPFDNGKWDTVMKARVLWASVLYQQGLVKNFIFSGGAVYSPYYEAKIMGLYAQKLGIPKNHIFYDTVAEHSTENVYYSYEIARKQGFKSIALVTDPFQSTMLKSFTKRRFKSDIQHLPFLVDTIKKYSWIEPDIDPASAYNAKFISIKKRQSFFVRLWGTLGKRLDWSEGEVRPSL